MTPTTGTVERFQQLYLYCLYETLTPSYAYLILFYVGVLSHVGDGPLWSRYVHPEIEACKANWWTNMLYISNYVNAENVCMLQSWFLNCDFHFFLLGLVLITIWHRNELIAKIVTLACLLIAIIIPAVTTIVHKYSLIHPTAIVELMGLKSHVNFIEGYIKSHNRAAPYIIGMIGGYLYNYMKNNDKKFTRTVSNSISVISLLLICATFFSGSYFFQAYYKYNVIEMSLYIPTRRVFWAVGTVGLIMTVNFGHSYMIRNILCWKPFVPMAKLIYGAFLSHMVFVIRGMGISRSPLHYDMMFMSALMVGYFAMSYASSLFLYICIEAPVKHMYSALMLSRAEPRKEEATMSSAHPSTSTIS